MRLYLLIMFAGALATVAVTATINWAIDPYWIWKSQTIPGLSEFKPAVRDNIRIFKIGTARHFRPEVVILGTSRADDGLDPKHPAFEGRRAINLASPAQPYEESLSLFEWTIDELHTKTVVLTLDMLAANAYYKLPTDYQAGNTDRARDLRLLLSLDTLVDTTRTILNQSIERTRRAEPDKYVNYREDGMRIIGKDKAKEWGGHRNAFVSLETTMLNAVYLPPPRCKFTLEDSTHARFPMLALRQLIADAYQKNIELRLAISPIHARLVEAMASIDLWNTWEKWKQQLVEINESEAAKVNRPPFPLWDFSGYSSITTEPVPKPGDANTRMRWYWESSHYKKETGDLMLNKMFGRQSAGDSVVPADFGMQLTTTTLTQHLQRLRDGRAQFRKNFPGDIIEIENAANKAAARRRSLGCG